MNKPTAVHRDGLRPRYEYGGAEADAPMLNAVCGLCGKRRYDPLGSKDRHILIADCSLCIKRREEKAAAKRADDVLKASAMARAKLERALARRRNDV